MRNNAKLMFVGHHAVKSRSMGFCIFNFAVGAAVYGLQKKGLKKIGIIDFDVVIP